MQKKINTLTDLVSKSGLKPTQKQLAFNIIAEIVLKYNLLERDYQKRIKQDGKIKSEFTDYFDRVYTLLLLCGITEIDVYNLNYEYSRWIQDRQENDEILHQLDFISLQQLFGYIRLYHMAYNKLPLSMIDLRQFILEPMEVEKDFDTAFENALRQFKKDLVPTEILKVGWAKSIMDKIIVKK